MTDAPERITAWVTRNGVTKWEAGSLQFPPDTEVEYIRADLACPKVKPLEWWQSDTFDLCADTIIGRYQIQAVASNANFRLFFPGGEFKCSDITCWPFEDAKAIAQADYERRILSALQNKGEDREDG